MLCSAPGVWGVERLAAPSGGGGRLSIPLVTQFGVGLCPPQPPLASSAVMRSCGHVVDWKVVVVVVGEECGGGDGCSDRIVEIWRLVLVAFGG